MANNEVVLGGRLFTLCDNDNNAPSAANVQSFIDKGANVNTKGRAGETILIVAVLHGYLEAVKTLLTARGIDIDAKDNNGMKALMYAFRHIEITKALLAAHNKTPNFDINDANTIHGCTALMYSCMQSRAELVKFLLPIPNINAYMKNAEGKTALDYTKGTRNEYEMRALFQGELPPFQPQIKSAQQNHTHSPPLLLTSTISLPLSDFIQSHVVHVFTFTAYDNRAMRFLVLLCVDSVDKKFSEREELGENNAPSGEYFAYKRYMANNGVQPLMMKPKQALYLDTLSNNAQLFFLAFTHVDGTDGIANGIARIILSYLGRRRKSDEITEGKMKEAAVLETRRNKEAAAEETRREESAKAIENSEAAAASLLAELGLEEEVESKKKKNKNKSVDGGEGQENSKKKSTKKSSIKKKGGGK
jgi:hypothetical protein